MLTADQLPISVQLKADRTQMIAETVSVKIVDTGRWRALPVQNANAVESGLYDDDLQPLPGAGVGTHFQARQITDVGEQTACAGQG